MIKKFCALVMVFATIGISNSYGAQDFCGRIKSLPDAWLVLDKGSKIYFDSSDTSDPNGVYAYLNKYHTDANRGCYCIIGTVTNLRAGARLLSEVTGLKTCQGTMLK